MLWGNAEGFVTFVWGCEGVSSGQEIFYRGWKRGIKEVLLMPFNGFFALKLSHSRNIRL